MFLALADWAVGRGATGISIRSVEFSNYRSRGTETDQYVLSLRQGTTERPFFGQ